jgi:hypothetical protein
MTATKMDEFTLAYLEAALWSSTDDNDDPLDRNYSVEDIAPESLAAIAADCAKWLADNAALLERADYGRRGSEYGHLACAGHDYWLTRNGHGAGFWDRDFTDPTVGDELSESARKAGEAYLYVGDDGLIYCY